MATLANPTGKLWTSAEVAHAFRVGVSSVKRWTDEHELESVRTPGGHRRYTLAALHRFARARKLPVDRLPELVDADVAAELPPPANVTLLEALLSGDGAAIRRLVTPRVDGLSRRAAFLDRVVGEAMYEVGERWESGKLSVEEEHRASYLIAEAIDRLRPGSAADAPLALLACPPGELHDIPLRLLRLMFEWSGWRTEFVGASVPWDSLRNGIDRWNPKVVALSARSAEPFLYGEFERIVTYCRAKNVTAIVGGGWARGGPGAVDGYYRFRTLRGFERWLRTVAPRRRSHAA